MGTNRKVEEKKMSMNKNIARLAVTAGLTAALSFGGVMAPVTMAFAEGTDGSVTINNYKGNATEFKGYQIFNADVADGTASNITWANGAVQKAVENVIRAEDKSYVGTTAQDAADWITEKVTGTAETTRVDSNSIPYKIADAVDGLTESAKTTNKTVSSLDHGYWLFVTDADTIGDGEAGTSPIFIVVGSTPVNIDEKTSIPTVDKQIFNGGTNKTADPMSNDWDYVGDSQIGQDIDYKLTGTVADNIASYTKYTYVFQDTLSKGLVVTKETDNTTPKDLHVYIVNGNSKVEVKSGCEVTVKPASDGQNSELLKVSFDDLKAVKDAKSNPITVDKYSNVVVTYKAHLTKDASYEVTGNSNTVKLVYSNNPMGGGTGISTGKTVADYAFRLDVTKVDQKDPTKTLKAGFKVKVVANVDNALVGRWLSADGNLVDENEAYEFTTEESTGKVLIPGLDAGTYQITETTTPAGYNTIAPFTITVAPNYTNGQLDGLTVSDDSIMVESKSATGATIPVTIQNKKGSGLPLTGLNGVTFTWIAGGAVLCIGVAHLIRSRKQAEESEQE